MDFITVFTSALEKAGIASTSAIIGDGRFRRYNVAGDNKGRKNGWYRLTVDGDFAFGAFGSWKHSVSESFSSKSEQEYTPIDREKIARKRKQIEDQEKADQAAAAARAAGIWAKASICEDHPYAIKKGIKLHGVRESRGMLLVPVYRRDGDKMTLTSLQFISQEGEKKFLTGGQVQGCYMTIAESGSNKEVLYICEGYATGASIFEASGGRPVIVAYNSNNLKPVAEIIKKNNPTASIIIAGDNDQWTKKQDGTLFNPGVVMGKEAAKAVGARVTWPGFPNDDPEHRTDFNDFHALHGLDAVRDELLKNPAERVIELPPEMKEIAVGDAPDFPQDREIATAPGKWFKPEDWRQELIPGKEVVAGFPHPYDNKSKMNAYLFFKHSEAINASFVYDEFADQILMLRCPRWEDPEKFSPREINDEDFFMISCHLERVGMKVGVDVARHACLKTAKESKINPPRDYFETLKWDGIPRLDFWLKDFMGANSQPQEYLALVGAKWLIGSVSRIYNPGAKFDSMIVFEGKQRIGKSLALQYLATFNGHKYFGDNFGDIHNKDTLMTLQGKLIIEVGEMASFKKAENNDKKAFITRQEDEYRPPYGRTVMRRPRYFVLAGTTNETEDGYLTDDTGNGRYWPVRCDEIDLDGLQQVKEQLWAEAIYRFKTGERTWLLKEQLDVAMQQQDSRMVEDAWQSKIEGFLRSEYTITVDEICNKLELKPRDINNIAKNRIKKCLRALGWKDARGKGEKKGSRPRVFKPGPDAEDKENGIQQDMLDLVIE